MADLKISALLSATTPLAGTEVLPIVQSSTTTKVSVANLTAGRDISASGLFIDANSATNAVRITQTGAGNALVVEDEANPDSTPFVIDASGNIASGLTSTGLALEIYRTVAATFRLDGDGTGTTLQARSFNSTSADTAAVVNIVRARGTKAVSTIVQSGDLLAQYRGAGWDGVGFIQAANIEVRVDGAPGTNDMPGRLVFNTTADGAASPTERVRIDNAGNVGIGGAAANASAILDAQSTTKGVRMPNMTTAQKNAIATPAAGLMVFDTSLAKLCVYSGAAWQTITSI
jgi:hypothetical protein